GDQTTRTSKKERYAMNENRVVPFRQEDEIDDPLTEILRTGARRLITRAVEIEFDTFLASNADLALPDGRQRVVRHGHDPVRTVQTGIGPVDVQKPPRYCPQGALGRGCHRGNWPWPQGSQVADQRHLADDAVERLAQGCWRVDDDGLECDHGLCSALHGSVARHLQVPDHLDRAGAGFGLCVRLAAKHGACCALSVERIAFSVLMPELTIGAVHLDNSIPLRLQKKTRETRAMRSGALNAKGMDRTERSRPGFEMVAFGAYGDCQRPKTDPNPVDRDSGVDVFVGVNADDDFAKVGLAHVEGSPEVRT